MKRYGIGSIFGLMVFSAVAQEVPPEVNGETVAEVNVPTNAATASVGAEALPEGVTSEQNPLKVLYLQKRGLVPAVYRPNPSMPEIVNQTLLEGMAATGKQPDSMSLFFGYKPKLKVLPCAKGCEGREYEKSVKAFISGFDADKKHWKERGELIVQVRWFNARPFFQRSLPYGADQFGVSYMLEGKVISIGKSSGVGTSIRAHELASRVGSRIVQDLVLSLALGAKPLSLLPEGRDKGFAAKFMNASASFEDKLGVDDIRPRIEPATEAHAVLLPAIDGIAPNEVAPLDQMYYLNSWKY
jgi:hypothetical protein